jgi:hypothetical protein
MFRETGNSKCADCRAPNPNWASYNLGMYALWIGVDRRDFCVCSMCCYSS